MPRRDRRLYCAAIFLLSIASRAVADDWPTYRHDNQRSGATAENLDAARLVPAWVYQSSQPPRQAWAGAADVDAFRKQRGLGDTRLYDPVFHCVIARERVYFGSSADDAVHCLDLATGREVWNFTTGGPVRVAPTIADGRLHVGSDDGLAYALDAATGKLLWQFQPPCPQTRVVNDGRLISLWPCRTGVMVDRQTAYFAMSMLPWKATFVCAVDAATGRAEGAGHYVRRYEDDLTLEAALLATDTQIIAPQGRSSTVVLERETGKQVGNVAGASTFAVLTAEQELISGPFSRDIGLRGTDVAQRQQLAWHPNALALVATPDQIYVLGDQSVSVAMSKAESSRRWSTRLNAALALILAGDTLFAGCDGEVVAIDRHKGTVLWHHPVRGRAYGLAVGNGSLLVSTDEGWIYSFQAGTAKPATTHEAAAATGDKQLPLPDIKAGLSVPLAAEPVVQFISPEAAVVRWETSEPSPTLLRYTVKGIEHQEYDATARTEHSVTLQGLPRNRQVPLQVFARQGTELGVASHRMLDTFFNYASSSLPAGRQPYEPSHDSRAEKLAAQVLADSDATTGVCLVLGSTDGRLAWELARQSRLRVVALDDDLRQVRDLRDRWQQAQVYGVHLSAVHASSFEDAALPAMLANLIVDEQLISTGKPSASATAMVEWLRPRGGKIYLGDAAASTLHAFTALGLKREGGGSGKSLFVTREPLPGSGNWDHQYGAADNAGYAGETLGGSRAATDLEVQWIGRPGPRDHADRQTRHPAPLCTAGRLFIQGQERIVAVDAYNGVPLWSLEIPGLERYDIPHDAGNWAANDKFLFVANGNRCWQIAADKGTIVKRLPVIPGSKAEGAYDWGYVAVVDDLLIGSANLQSANSKGWWGGEFWRDDEVNTIAASDNLFAIDWRTGKPAWVYRSGILPNSAIAIADGAVYFVESRDPAVIEGYSGRVMLHASWPQRYLVALNIQTGKKLWEVPLEIQGGQAIFSMAWSEGKLVICSSADGKYYVYAIRAQDGQPVWQQTVDWGGRGHGAQYSRPVIVEGVVFVRPHALSLADGTLLPARMPGGGCGTYCASRDALFFRSGDITVWSPETEQLSGFSRLRPGCWLSAVPAAGLLLSPEAGGGCSCGGWMETSIAFAPTRNPPPSFMTRNRNFIDSLSVELFSRDPGAEIHYTLDGSEPNETSPVYSQSVTISRAVTFKAAAYYSTNRQRSRSATVTATFVRHYPAPAIPDEVTTFTDSLALELKRHGTTGVIYYTLDGSEPTRESLRCDGPLLLTADADLAARTVWEHPDGETSQSEIVRQRFYKVSKQLPRSVNITFQHKAAPRPDDFEIDSGETFRPQPSGYFYGWTQDMRTRVGSRGDLHDPLRNTFIHCMANTAWEIEVENGRYEVMVCVGETFYGQERATIYVEGVEFCKDLQLPRKETREITRTVEITDGRISLTSHEDSRVQKATRLNHLRIRRFD